MFIAAAPLQKSGVAVLPEPSVARRHRHASLLDAHDDCAHHEKARAPRSRQHRALDRCTDNRHCPNQAPRNHTTCRRPHCHQALADIATVRGTRVLCVKLTRRTNFKVSSVASINDQALTPQGIIHNKVDRRLSLSRPEIGDLRVCSNRSYHEEYSHGQVSLIQDEHLRRRRRSIDVW
jgi:hypothetical protein